MRYIKFEEIVDVVKLLCIRAAYELPEDVAAALEKAEHCESNPRAAGILGKLLENARIARDEKIPLCQDTGLAVVFIEQGAEVFVKADGGKTLFDAVNQGVSVGYEQGCLRKSVVADPLNRRANTGTNTPAVIHHSVVAGGKLKITIMAKGGGCENKSAFKMFKPTAERNDIIDWVVGVSESAGADACPPFIIGVGLGGNFELSCLLSKKALLRNLDVKNSDEYYAELEQEILSRVNALGVGPQGFGGDTTALACLIETTACHIASLPAAVNIECHSHRHKTVVI